MGNEVLAQILRDLSRAASLISLMYQSRSAAEHSHDEHVDDRRGARAPSDEARAVRLMTEHLEHVEAQPARFDRQRARPSDIALRPLVNADTMTYDSTAPYPRDLRRLRPQPAACAVAGRRAHRGAVRPELRGRRRELRAARRRRLASSSCPRCSTRAGLPDRHLSMEGIYEYGSRVGVWRILREFEKRGLPLTVFGVGMALRALPRADRRLHGTGPRDRLPRLALDPLPEHRRSHRARAHAPGHGRSSRS